MSVWKDDYIIMRENQINFGELVYDIDDRAQNIVTICLTEDCNLRCKYCYMKGKNSFKKIDFKTAAKAVDCILEAKNIYNKNSVIWDFIGGEPFLEIELLDRVSDYIKKRMFELLHPWGKNYKFRILTNGILYGNEKVQKYIDKNRKNLTIGISIDGNKIKHDLQRIYSNGRGSYDDVIKNVPLWLSQFENTYSKTTFAHDDLPYVKDSIIHLWELGIKRISANIVFEDVWTKSDPTIFENQLRLLADYIIEKGIWDKFGYDVKFFNPTIGFPLSNKFTNNTYCGAGIEEITVDCDGNFYPCIRFLDFSLSKNKSITIGNIKTGILKEKLNIFKCLTRNKVDPSTCKKCKVRSGCLTCAGLNYDESTQEPLFKRTTYNCEMHKANVRAVEYFWDKVGTQLVSQDNPREIAKSKYIG